MNVAPSQFMRLYLFIMLIFKQIHLCQTQTKKIQYHEAVSIFMVSTGFEAKSPLQRSVHLDC